LFLTCPKDEQLRIIKIRGITFFIGWIIMFE
jgi:hypothetical protein